MKKLSTHQRKARDFMQREDWDNALSELQNVLASDANNPTLHNQMGDVFLRKNDIEHACEHFEKSIELYAQLGLHNNAVALCRKVVRLCPERIEVRYRLARLRLEQGLRSEATASLEEYFEQLNPDSEEALGLLESRGREMIEEYPDMAPVGKILEKLEAGRSFSVAFEIVQRLARRAADAGEDAAARRYTEKMRSLRVLVEGNGGGDLLATENVDLMEGPEELGTTTSAPEAAAPAPSPSKDPVQMEPTDPVEGVSLDLPTADSGSDPGAIPDETIELSLQAPWKADASSVEDAPQFELPSVEASTRPETEKNATVTPEALENDLSFAADSEGAADGEREYEIPETSLEEIAGLLQEEEPLPETPPAEEGTTAGATTEHAAKAGAWAESDQHWNFGEKNEVPPSSEQAPETPATAAARQDSSSDFSEPFQPSPGTGGGPASVSKSSLPRDPVWIPDPSIRDQDPNPDNPGEVQQLDVVIDTFREQMANALGEDGDARYDLGVAYYEMGLYNEALVEFEVAARCGGFRERSLEMMAACLMQQDRHAEVVELLQSALEANGGSAQNRLGLRYSMGLAFEALGRSEEARRNFEEVALVDIGFKDVQVRLQRL